MVKFEIKISPKERMAYIPKEIVEALGYRLVAVPNLKGVYLYPKDLPLEQAVISVTNILRHLKQQLQLEKEVKHDE
ncbi:MAG: hypothetical protein QXJ07_03400 [Candidatus Bathyarchaeia archaeon]